MVKIPVLLIAPSSGYTIATTMLSSNPHLDVVQVFGGSVDPLPAWNTWWRKVSDISKARSFVGEIDKAKGKQRRLEVEDFLVSIGTIENRSSVHEMDNWIDLSNCLEKMDRSSNGLLLVFRPFWANDSFPSWLATWLVTGKFSLLSSAFPSSESSWQEWNSLLKYVGIQYSSFGEKEGLESYELDAGIREKHLNSDQFISDDVWSSISSVYLPQAYYRLLLSDPILPPKWDSMESEKDVSRKTSAVLGASRVYGGKFTYERDTEKHKEKSFVFSDILFHDDCLIQADNRKLFQNIIESVTDQQR